MRKIFVILASLFAFHAQAQSQEEATPDWFSRMENYREEVKTYTDRQLFWRQFDNYGGAALGCMGSGAFTAVAFIADTLPLTNPVAEWVANKANAKYESNRYFLSWENMVNMGRGSLGGAVIAQYEAAEFVVMWLSGDTTRAFSALKANYASTFAAIDGLFRTESQCWTNIARVAVVRAEYRRRAGETPVLNFTPMRLQ